MNLIYEYHIKRKFNGHKYSTFVLARKNKKYHILAIGAFSQQSSYPAWLCGTGLVI